MKIVNAFAHIFAVFAFLTLGSLFMLVSLHILSVDDAVLRVRELYMSPIRSIQTGFVGLLFITIGLAFSKILVKRGRPQEAVIFQSEIGPIVVSVTAIEDIAKKVLKRFHLVKEWKIKTMIRGKKVELKLRLVLWSGSRVTELLSEIQTEIRSRMKKLLGRENQVEVTCDVLRIEDHESSIPEIESEQDKPVMLYQ